MSYKLCKECGQPMLPKGAVKRENEYNHASGCPIGVAAGQFCYDCPPAAYPADATRCHFCPRSRSNRMKAEGITEQDIADTNFPKSPEFR